MQNEAKLLTIAQAAEFLKVSPDTLRRWEDKGIVAPHRTKGGSRRYTLLDLKIAKLNKKKTSVFQIPTLLKQTSKKDIKVALFTSFLWIIALVAYHLLTPIFLTPTNPEQRIISNQLKEQSRLNIASETTPSEIDSIKVVVNVDKAPVEERIISPSAGPDLLIRQSNSLPALEYSNVPNQYYSLQPLPKNQRPTLIIKES